MIIDTIIPISEYLFNFNGILCHLPSNYWRNYYAFKPISYIIINANATHGIRNNGEIAVYRLFHKELRD